MELKALLIFGSSLIIMGFGPLIFFETWCLNAEEQQGTTQSVAFTATAEPTSTSVRGAVEKKELQHLFSIWNGACKPLERMVKNVMQNPRSYKHIKTRYTDYGDRLRVTLVFCSKNALGVSVQKTISADMSPEGTLSKIIGPE